LGWAAGNGVGRPEEDAAKILSKLKPKQIEAVSIEIAQLGSVRSDEQQEAILEFADINPKSLGGIGGLEVAQNLVQRAMGREATSTLDNLRQSIEALPFGFLKKVDPQNVLTFLVDEHPQTIALILSHLPAANSALILAGLPAGAQLAVIRRVAHMGTTSPEMIKQVEEALEKRMQSVMTQSLERAGGVESVAEILNVADRATERALLENLNQEDPELVEEIRRLMFVFEDIVLVDVDVGGGDLFGVHLHPGGARDGALLDTIEDVANGDFTDAAFVTVGGDFATQQSNGCLGEQWRGQ
jgi:flagellar motor switch protein FliG